jgi:alpha-glucosidase (family GH31 glycosyl hydrolase)
VPTNISTGPELVVLERGSLRVEVALRPFALTVRRAGRRLIRSGGAWVADGTVHDHFVQFTEGVVPREELAPAERAVRASVVTRARDAVVLALTLEGGRRATLGVNVSKRDLVALEVAAEGEPLRLALDWDPRSEEHFVGLGARHCTQLDQAGRVVQLGADRRYTGPDCPLDMLAAGGIPQGDCAPLPWLLSSRGYGAWVQTESNGCRFDLAGERVSVSTRAAAGPLRLRLLCDSTPAARLRAFCRVSGGVPALLPEWGYGFWKSRDVHEHQDDVLDDYHGFRRHEIPLDAIVIDSPWATQYNTWEFNPHQFPDAPGMVSMLRADGVRTVVWATPWVNLDSRDGQIPPQPESERLHREPAPTYAPAAAAGHFVRSGAGRGPLVAQWGWGSGRRSTSRAPPPRSGGASRPSGSSHSASRESRQTTARATTSRTTCRCRMGAAAWRLRGRWAGCIVRAFSERSTRSAACRGVLFGRSGWTGQSGVGVTWGGGDQASDFWSLRVLIVATLTAACSGISNWSHDIGGYLGHRLVERCPPELLVRWLQFGCFTPLMHAHSRMPQEPWNYGKRVLELYRAYVLLHEQLVPYVRAAAATAARSGLPIIRPLCLVDPADSHGWTIGDAYAYGPALWVAPVLDDGAREREVALPRGKWIETWTGAPMPGRREVVVDAPLNRIPVWVRAGSIVVTYPAAHVARGLGDDASERERPLVATLWGPPPLGRAATRLADGTRISWRAGRWSVTPSRDVEFREIAL